MSTNPDPPASAAGGTGERGPSSDRQPHPVLDLVQALTAGLDRAASVPAWSMTPTEQRDALLGLRRQAARLAELELRVLVAADRNGVGTEEGATSTAAWLAQQTRTTTRSRLRDLHLARALDDGFETTRSALAAGDLDVEQAGVIVHAVEALTAEYDDLPAGAPAEAEAHLVRLAGDFDAVGLRRLGRRLVEVVCPGAADAAEGRALAAEEERARRLAFLTLRDNADGTSEGRFRLPTLHAGLLRKAVESLTAPRRVGSARRDPATGTRLPHGTVLGHGLMDLLENHLDLESLPSVNGSPFTLVVTVPLDSLRSARGAGEAETGDRVSAGEARRLACRAGVIPMVLDGDSVPLDLGREQRLFSRYQKIAANHRHGGCAAAGCDRPPSFVEYHHDHAWQQGGATDLGNCLPLCPPHHRMADDPERWDSRRHPDGSVRFHRRT